MNSIFKRKLSIPLAQAGFAFLFFLVGLGGIQASHLIGADISYKALDSLKFELTFKIYRDCNSVALTNPSSWTSIRCLTTSKLLGLTPTLISIRDLTPTCDTATKRCNPANTKGTGYGVEEHVYRDTIDLRTSPYKALTVNCCQLRIELYGCCRSSSITTGAANRMYYNYALLDICKAPKNSSPIFTSDAFFNLCCNQPIYFNPGAQDTVDFDSLSYRLAYPLCRYSCNISYGGKWPLTVYDPTGKGIVNQNANPPIGLFLDPETGDFICTPVKCGEVSPIVIEVKEWRKDSTGAHRLIGITRQDVLFRIDKCKDNNPPIINGPYAYNVCAGDKICFNVTTDDKVVKPPPPAKSPPPDTVTLSWDKGIPMATFRILNDSALLQTGRFCWTPKESDARFLPYTFTVRAQDNNCPIRTSTYRSFSVLVKPRASAKLDISSIGCSKFRLSAEIDSSSFSTPAKYTWLVLNKDGQYIGDKRIAPYFPSGHWISKNAVDTIQFRHPGTYIIQLRLNNRSNCPIIYEDTLAIDSVFESRIASKSDTFQCEDHLLNLIPAMSYGNSPYTYKWSTQDSTSSIQYDLHDTLDIDTLWLQTVDSLGCQAFDEIEVMRRSIPKVMLLADSLVCEGETVVLNPNAQFAFWDDPRNPDTTNVQQGSQLYFKWTYDSSIVGTDSTLTVKSSGRYAVRVTDSTNCFSETTFTLNQNTIKADAGKDLSICSGDRIDLKLDYFDSISQGKTGSYQWRDITDVSFPVIIKDTFRIIDKDQRLELKITLDQNGVICSKTDTVFYTAIALPTIVMPDDLTHCCDNGTINLKSLENAGSSGGTWSSSDTSLIKYDSIYDAGPCKSDVEIDTLYYLLTDTSTRCSSLDSFYIRVQPLPPLGLNALDICSRIDSLDPVKDGLTAFKVKWTDYQYQWACINCSKGFWDSLYSDSGNYPTFNVGKPVFNLDDNSYASINLILSLRDSFGCSNVDTTILRVLGVPKIDRSLFKGSEPYQLCSEDGNLLLQTNDYPSVWSLKNGGVISDNQLVLDTMTTGGDKLILKAGYGCSSDTVDFDLFKTKHIQYLRNDTSILSQLDLSMVLKIKAQNASQINWFTISSATLDVSSGLQNIIFFPHNKTIDLIEVPVWIKSGSKSPCEDKVDTTVFTLRPDPCTNFEIAKQGNQLRLIAENSGATSFKWELDDGRTSSSRDTTFEISDWQKAFNVDLSTLNAFGDSCVVSQIVDFSLIRNSRTNTLKVYPNPVDGQLTISGIPLASNQSYSILDVTGRTMQRGFIASNTIDCSALLEGWYVLSLKGDWGALRKSFVIRR